MSNKNYQDFAEVILRRSQERLNPNLTLAQQEESSFFCWLMSRMLWRIEGCWPAKEQNQIELKAYTVPDGRVRVEHGRVSEHWTDINLKAEEFYDIMEKVAKNIDEMPNYRTTFFHSDNSDEAELYIFLSAKPEKKECTENEIYKLVGILNMFDISPDFVYPIFEKDRKYYFQTGDIQKLQISEFSPVKESYISKVVLLNQVENNLIERKESSLQSEPIFAFQKDKNSVFIGTYQEMVDVLLTFEADNEILKEQIKDFINKEG